MHIACGTWGPWGQLYGGTSKSNAPQTYFHLQSFSMTPYADFTFTYMATVADQFMPSQHGKHPSSDFDRPSFTRFPFREVSGSTLFAYSFHRNRPPSREWHLILSGSILHIALADSISLVSWSKTRSRIWLEKDSKLETRKLLVSKSNVTQTVAFYSRGLFEFAGSKSDSGG